MAEDEFNIDTRSRFAHSAFLFLQLIATYFATFTVLEILFGDPIHIGFVFICLFIALSLHACYRRIAWGSCIRFKGSEMLFIRGGKEIRSVPLGKVQDVRIKKKSVSLIYRMDGRWKRVFVGREGFSESLWRDFTQRFALHVKSHKDA